MKCCEKVAGFYYHEKEKCEPRRHREHRGKTIRREYFKKEFHAKTRRRKEKEKEMIL